MPRVFNKRDPDIPEDAVYVGRPSDWGNPYVIGKHGSREEVLDKYRLHLEGLMDGNPDFRDRIKELRGKDLVCWCAPLPCHADILMEVANA